MGAWGFGPLDNDTALDYIGDWHEDQELEEGEEPIPAPTVDELLFTLMSFNNDEYIAEFRAAAHLFPRLYSTFMTDKLRARVQAGFDFVLECDEWLTSWVDEDAVRREIERERAEWV